ncbi:MAG: biotin/lipoyl-binding protein, partial [Methylococcales bacterium]|nr:biotin/lipoyl-binding protein [Methylococcales bacterium]
MNKKGLFFCMVLLLLTAGYYFTKSPDRISVILHKVEKGEVKTTVSNTRVGTIKACRRAYLAPATGGNVAKLFVKEGEKVKKKQLLLEVWNEDLKAQLKLYKAQIKTNKATASQLCELASGAERDANRLKRLKHEDHIVSDEQVDRAVTAAKA